jgi:hypothetical protein
MFPHCRRALAELLKTKGVLPMSNSNVGFSSTTATNADGLPVLNVLFKRGEGLERTSRFSAEREAMLAQLGDDAKTWAVFWVQAAPWANGVFPTHLNARLTVTVCDSSYTLQNFEEHIASLSVPLSFVKGPFVVIAVPLEDNTVSVLQCQLEKTGDETVRYTGEVNTGYAFYEMSVPENLPKYP